MENSGVKKIFKEKIKFDTFGFRKICGPYGAKGAPWWPRG